MICLCGCGEEFTPTKHCRLGYKQGHFTRTYPSSIFNKKRNKKVSIAKLNSLNPMWRGKKVGYRSLHAWVKRRLFKPEFCQECNKRKPCDLANISQEYKRDLLDWEWLCRHCHMTKDGRMKNLNQYNKKIVWNKGKKFSGRPSASNEI